MCYNYRLRKSGLELEQRFNARIEEPSLFQPSTYNAFVFPKAPVITNREREWIRLFNWGLIPHWAKDDSIKKHTLNARIETIRQKPSFRDAAANRCLVLADGFYEWQWLDEKGKQKQKYELVLPGEEAFALAGLYSDWKNPATGEILHTFTILTTAANELLSEIHNSKKRMPVVLSSEGEAAWLDGRDPLMQNDNLIARPV